MRFGGIWSLIILSTLCSIGSATFCLEGSDCQDTHICGICEGAACVRIFRPAKHTVKEISSLALTCLPHDSLVHAYNPDGCRKTLHGDVYCLCSLDYCNSSKNFQFAGFVIFVILLIYFA